MSSRTLEFATITKDAWAVMLQDIRNAKTSICMEQYIFAVDSVGKEFLDALQLKAQEGISIKILCDMVGSVGFYRSLLPEFLEKINVKIRFFNPVSLWRITNFTSNFLRDHRKLLIIDNEIAHVGGVGVQEHMADWRDTHVRVMGPLVNEIANSFKTIWDGVVRSRFVRFKKPTGAVPKYDFLTNSPGFRQRFIYHTLINKINSAKKYVYLTTPYFIPDVPIYRALRAAGKRGVDVRLIVPKVADHIFINHARESYFSLSLKAKIRIFVYTPVMMHAKTAIVDDWAMAGSFNFDSLSFNFNHEANIASGDEDFVNKIKEHFENDIDFSEEIKYEIWSKRSWRKKFLELLTWPFHGLM